MPKLPHVDVYTRLAPSKIHGVGVFAIVDIPKDTNLFGPDDTDLVEVPAGDITDLMDSQQDLYHDFAPLVGGYYRCPPSFNMMSAAWYLNHSETPNCRCDESDYSFYSLVDIPAGTELTVDYNTYSEQGL